VRRVVERQSCHFPCRFFAILIVEDEPNSRIVLGKLMSDAGYAIAFASNGWKRC